jgi:hypothetical protein
MTNPYGTGTRILVHAPTTATGHWLVTDNLLTLLPGEPRRAARTHEDPVTGITTQVLVVCDDDTSGWLAPNPDRCPLCTGHGHITVREGTLPRNDGGENRHPRRSLHRLSARRALRTGAGRPRRRPQALPAVPVYRLRDADGRRTRVHLMSLYDRHDAETAPHCRWCIDGMTPAGIHPDLGPVLRLCPTQRWCDECVDTSLFPAEWETLDDRINEMLADGYAAVWCEHCNGITAVLPVTNDGGIR